MLIQRDFYLQVDMGLRNALLGMRQMEETHIMENVIYNELRRRAFSLFRSTDYAYIIISLRLTFSQSNRGSSSCTVRGVGWGSRPAVWARKPIISLAE